MPEVAAGPGVSGKMPVPAGSTPAAIIEDPQKPGIRIFDDAAIQSAIDAQTARLPPGKPVAVVAFMDKDKTIRSAATVRIGDDWSIMGKFEKKWNKRPDFEAGVVWTP